MKNLKQYFIFLLLIINISCFGLISPKTTIFAENKTNTTSISSSAKALVVMEQNTNRILLSKNEHTKLPMASTTKIITAIVAIENCDDLNERFIVDNKSVGTEGSSMYLKEGEEVSIKELLYGLMLVSGNDASVAIASRICNGNIQNFVDLMNKKASELNCLNTHFDNPHGLDSETHYTTAYDLAKITSYALKNEVFKEIVSTKTIKIGERFLKNKQKLLFTLPGCTGVKTGFTDNALRCSVSSFSSDALDLVCVVLNCPDMFEESARLINLVSNTYKNYEILKPYTALDAISINNGKKNKVWAVNNIGLTYPLTPEEYNKLNIIINCKEILEAPVKKGEIVGNIKVYINNDLIFETNLCTIEEVNKENVLDKANKIMQELF